MRYDETQDKTLPEVNRVIVNRGILRLTQEMRECQSFSLYTQVERKDLNASLNVKRPRPSSFYGYAQGLEGGYVVWEKPITFENEELWYWQNSHGVLLQAIDCAVFTIKEHVTGIAVQLGAIVQPIAPAIIPIERLSIDTIAFKLFGKTTLYLRAIWRPVDEPCSAPLQWFDREDPARPLGGTNLPLPPPNIPVNIVDPDRYDLGDEPYSAPDDYGDTYTPPRPNCTGCTITITHAQPGQPRFPGGPPAVDPNAVLNFTPEQCPVRVETFPDLGGASFEVDANYRAYDRNNNIVFQGTSYVFNPFTVTVDNGECF